MPISNKGTRLSVTTNIGGEIYKDESHRDLFYGRNQQKDKTPPALTAPGNTRPFGHNRGPEHPSDVAAVTPDKKIEEAVEKDLTKRRLKHPRKKTTPTKETK